MRVTSYALLDASCSNGVSDSRVAFFTNSYRISNTFSECPSGFRDPKRGPSAFGKKLIIYALLPHQIVVCLYQILSSLATNDIISRGRVFVWVVGINGSEINVTKIGVLHSSRAAHGHTYLTFSPWNGRWNTSIQEFGKLLRTFSFLCYKKDSVGKKCFMLHRNWWREVLLASGKSENSRLDQTWYIYNYIWIESLLCRW